MTQIHRHSSNENEQSERTMSSPEVLSTAEFTLKKKENRVNKLFQNPQSFNKSGLIESLNHLKSHHVAHKSENMYLEDSKECPNDTFSEILSLSFRDENSSHSSLDTEDVEPYLRKFEYENLNNSKSNIIENLKANDSLHMSPRKGSSIQTKNFNEESLDLFRLTQHLIPWGKIEPRSKHCLLDFVITNKTYLLDEDDHEVDFNVYNSNGVRINRKKVKEWVAILKDNYLFKILLKKRLNNMYRLGKNPRSHLVLPINDDDLYSNIVRLHSNEEIFDEVSEDSYVSDASTQSDSDDEILDQDYLRSAKPHKYQFTDKSKKLNSLKKDFNLKREESILKISEKRMSYQSWFEMFKKMKNYQNIDLNNFVS